MFFKLRLTAFLLMLVMLASIVIPTTYSQGGLQFDFTENPNNPIVPPDSFGHWALGGNIGQTVIVHEDMYYLFYTGISDIGVNPETGIGVARSEDGITWEQTDVNPLIRYNAIENSPGLMVVMVEDGLWTMIFSELNESLLYQSRLWRATADNAEGPWTLDSEPLLDFSERDWDRRVVPRGLLKVDDEYRLYYIGMTRRYGSFQMGLATSTDGLNWELYDEPLLTVGEEGDFDALGVGVSNPIPTDDGYALLYVGYDISPTTRFFSSDQTHILDFGYATSPDGITWTKYEGNPAFPSGLSAGPFMTLIPVEDKWYLYYDYRNQINASGIALMTGQVLE